jgi:S1-C subfamily serine protease
VRLVSLVAVVVAAGSLAFAWNAHSHAMKAVNAATSAIQSVSTLSHEVKAVAAHNKALALSVGSAQKSLARRDAGLAPLASRVLQSVFTLETDRKLGAGFAAWFANGDMYVITANHVIAEAGTGASVTVMRKGGSWSGEIVKTDRRDDLALVRVSGHPAGALALWQRPLLPVSRQGDQLLLVGSPYGLEGTVTTGVVSRVTKDAIQTDAAANPGSSGGPAVDLQGRVVGILVRGGAQNLNFAVPIAKACRLLRRCERR